MGKYLVVSFLSIIATIAVGVFVSMGHGLFTSPNGKNKALDGQETKTEFTDMQTTAVRSPEATSSDRGARGDRGRGESTPSQGVAQPADQAGEIIGGGDSAPQISENMQDMAGFDITSTEATPRETAQNQPPIQGQGTVSKSVPGLVFIERGAVERDAVQQAATDQVTTGQVTTGQVTTGQTASAQAAVSQAPASGVETGTKQYLYVEDLDLEIDRSQLDAIANQNGGAQIAQSNDSPVTTVPVTTMIGNNNVDTSTPEDTSGAVSPSATVPQRVVSEQASGQTDDQIRNQPEIASLNNSSEATQKPEQPSEPATSPSLPRSLGVRPQARKMASPNAPAAPITASTTDGVLQDDAVPITPVPKKPVVVLPRDETIKVLRPAPKTAEVELPVNALPTELNLDGPLNQSATEPQKEPAALLGRYYIDHASQVMIGTYR